MAPGLWVWGREREERGRDCNNGTGGLRERGETVRVREISMELAAGFQRQMWGGWDERYHFITAKVTGTEKKAEEEVERMASHRQSEWQDPPLPLVHP